MIDHCIAQICLEKDTRLIIRPESGSFPHIYRAGLSVYWDEAGSFLFTVVDDKKKLLECYKRIEKAVREEYGSALRITERTVWTNISAEGKKKISYNEL